MTPSWGIGRLALLLSTAVMAQAAGPQLEFEVASINRPNAPDWANSERYAIVAQQQEVDRDAGGVQRAAPGPQEQLGLKLETTKGPVEFLAIDRIERPPAN
jgi:Protein of unknown function (DUF3738)